MTGSVNCDGHDHYWVWSIKVDLTIIDTSEKSTRLVYTGLIGELEHLKIKTRSIDEKFASVMGEYVFLK